MVQVVVRSSTVIQPLPLPQVMIQSPSVEIPEVRHSSDLREANHSESLILFRTLNLPFPRRSTGVKLNVPGPGAELQTAQIEREIQNLHS